MLITFSMKSDEELQDIHIPYAIEVAISCVGGCGFGEALERGCVINFFQKLAQYSCLQIITIIQIISQNDFLSYAIRTSTTLARITNKSASF